MNQSGGSESTSGEINSTIVDASSRSVRQAELLAVLDREIDESHRQAVHAGWTPWALMTGLAALLWTFMDRVEHLTSETAVFRAAAATAMTIEVLVRARSHLELENSDQDDGRVDVTNEVLGAQRTALTLQFIYGCTLIWGFARFSHGVVELSAGAALVWAVWTVVTSLLGIAYSFWPVPLPVGGIAPTPVSMLAQGGQLAVPAIAVVGIACSLVPALPDDVRGGMLIGVAAAMLFAIARHPAAPPLVDELGDLRRQVSFGMLEPTEARERVTIILRGLKLEDYVQQDARKMLRDVAALRTTMERFRPIILEIEQLVEQVEQGDRLPGLAWKELLARWAKEEGEANDRYKRAVRWHGRFELRLQFASALSRLRKQPYEGQALIAEIEPQVKTVTSEYLALLEAYVAALGRLKRAIPADRPEA